jgi:hypothetical protein
VLGLQESAKEVERQLIADDLRPDAQHVDVVVLDALVGRVDVVAGAARIPRNLLAAMEAPTPVPQTMIPRSASPLRTASHTSSAMSGKSTGSGLSVPTSATSWPQERKVSTTGPFKGNPA